MNTTEKESTKINQIFFDTIQKNIEKHILNQSFKYAFGFIFDTPVKIGSYGKHDLFVNMINIYYDKNTNNPRLLFGVVWNKHNTYNNRFIRWVYNCDFLTESDLLKATSYALFKGSILPSKLVIDQNCIQPIFNAVNKPENIELTHKINNLHNSVMANKIGFEAKVEAEEYTYYFLRYVALYDYDYMTTRIANIPNLNPADYVNYDFLAHTKKNPVDNLFQRVKDLFAFYI